MKKNKVLIVGAGLSGITLGILLEKVGIPYEIYDRAKVVKPIRDELVRLGKRMATLTGYDDDLVPETFTDWSVRDPFLLLRQIPPNEIHIGKRVLSIMQNENGVMVRCSNNTMAKSLSASTKRTQDNNTFRNFEWGPEAAEQMCKQIGHLPVPSGNGKSTMKYPNKRTPKYLISKVMFEEKLLETWHHRRTVLLGDGM
ncbi:hypothetical protein BGZ52_001428 [Haplosporangium bisporale]|nr:hypothetical protein BGZ52_001428 [Haplosporangium bisporale]